MPAWRVVGEASVVTRFAASRSGGSIAARRPRSRNGADARSLASGARRRRPDRDGDRRGRDRQIALHRGAAGSASPASRMAASICNVRRITATARSIRSSSTYRARRASLQPNSPDARIEKLGALFAYRAAVGCVGASVAGGTAFDSARAAGPTSLTPAQRKAATIALLVDEIVRLGEARPMLLIVGRRALDRRHHARNDDAHIRQHRPGAAACPGHRAAGFRAALVGAAACDAADARALSAAQSAPNWSPESPPRTAYRRKRSRRSSPRPTAFRCSSRN